ncbi:hypothetical protein BH10PLA2_BH10PLA2_30300 [soil metagenome]
MPRPDQRAPPQTPALRKQGDTADQILWLNAGFIDCQQRLYQLRLSFDAIVILPEKTRLPHRPAS